MAVLELRAPTPDVRTSSQIAIRHQLEAVETAIEQALVEAARFTIVLADARRDCNMSAIVGDDATHGVAKAGALLADARSAVTAAHGDLERLRRRLRLQPVGFAGTEKPETDPPKDRG